MQKLGEQFSTVKTPQSQPIPGSTQVPNSAGGFSFTANDWSLLDRFLIIGTEGGSYYANEQKLTKENATVAVKLIAADGVRVVNRVVEVSDRGLASKNDPALFILAMASSLGNDETRKAAFLALPKVARIGTHLFHFAQYRQAFGGWGKGMKKAVSKWYSDKDVDSVAFQAVKYQGRDGWTHKDLLRLAHPLPENASRAAVYKWITGYAGGAIKDRQRLEAGTLPNIIQAFETLKGLEGDVVAAAKLVSASKMPREGIPTPLLTQPEIWEAMLPSMGLTALIRNLGTMSKIGFLVAGSAAEKTIRERLNDEVLLRKARVHPLQVLSALLTYQQGHGVKSAATWTVAPKIIDALDDAFYKSFEFVQPTGKRQMLALDVSGSMTWGEVGGVPGLTPRKAAAAFAMVTARVEKEYEFMAFCDKLVPLTITPKQRLDDVCAAMDRLSFGGTDCALPMVYATKNKREFDAFAVFTDSETWHGDIHPTQALAQYRKAHVKDAKLAVMGMVANQFTIADPKDPGQMDFIGCSADTPSVLANFIRGI